MADAENPPTDQDGRTGEVAETGRMDPKDADTPVSDDQSVAGSPSDESTPQDEDGDDSNVRAGSYRD